MEKINIAEILKDCPKGMELDCTIFDDVHFDYIDDVSDIINCYIQDSKHKIGISFSKYGCYSNISKSKCAIFPKGKTTWEGFQIPFKDGDIVATTSGTWIGITEGGKSGRFIPTYCVIMSNGEFEVYFDKKERWAFNRLATEEEKEKLFDAIKENGYKWNPETKTLEKLIEPKFNIGDNIQSKSSRNIFKIVQINSTCYTAKCKNDEQVTIDFAHQDNYELIPNKFDISTLKPFDKVLVRDTLERAWQIQFFERYEKELIYPFICMGLPYAKCIPYEKNEHLLNKTDDCDEYYKTWE